MKKLKYQYQQSVKTPHSNEFFLNHFPNMRSVYYKKFSTKQEKSFYSIHFIEYKDYPVKLRVARSSNLVDAWGDLPTYVTKVAKSWKHKEVDQEI
ncbi:hypothetical protein [Acinetobacter nosocomialis]|uniref:hypothetical protein n=1 Tax=Acinetobacter nosocomialis TaxID=106654 RepID=UPI0024DEB573|nr:hypothetical protein [Acinetobacter nosocomialis]